MNIAQTAINNRLWCSIIILLALAAGLLAYKNMPRFEDPEFLIRTAQVYTSYPGATPIEVAKEVTEKLESALQEMQEVDEIRSTSSAGLSLIEVDIKFDFSPDKESLGLIWNRLRAKIDDAQSHLPPGAQPSRVNDDFGDVYGIYYLIDGDDFTPAELYEYAKNLRTELLAVDGVGKIQITGVRPETIYLEFSREQIAAMGVSVNQIFEAVAQQNVVAPAGSVLLEDQRVRLHPGGAADSLEALKNTIVTTGNTRGLVHLSDIATVKRTYADPPSFLMRLNGSPALGLGISAVSGGNVVKLSHAIDDALQEESLRRPLGIDITEFYNQGDIVNKAINNFALNVLMALAIVLVTLIAFMGFRAAILIGAVLLTTIAATLATMYIVHIPMHRISLGALIIALGMLVDNAIVVADGLLVGLRQKRPLIDTANEVVKRTFWPLLGGTAVGIIAFAPIGFAPGLVAEFTGDLFWVIFISLMYSWVFAVFLVPFFASLLYDSEQHIKGDDQESEPFFRRQYREFIRAAMRVKKLALAAVYVLFALGIFAFQYVTPGFFPSSTTPQMVVNYWLPEGTDISRTNADLSEIESYLGALDDVEHVQTLVGGGTLRYMLMYQPEARNSSFGQLLVKVSDYNALDTLIPTVQRHLDERYPNADAKVWRFRMGPGGGSKVEAEFSGPDPTVLRDLADQAKAIMLADGGAISVKDDWRNPVPVIEANYSPERGRRAGMTRERFANLLDAAYGGVNVGVYREDDNLIPIVARSLSKQRNDVSNIGAIPMFATYGKKSLFVMEVVDDFETTWEDPRVLKRDRRLLIKAQCDPRPPELAATLEARLATKIEAIPLPPGYSFAWAGESGDSSEAQGELATTLPLGLLAMVLVVILLFNALRQPLIIWLTVPLALIGVVIGLLATQSAMEFMALLGILSLSGLLIKNAIVLVDQMDANIATGMPRMDAVVDASISRVQPVMLGAITTVLGIIPLFWDAFFRSMSVVLAFGLSFATLLTLVVVPLLYVVVFRIRNDETADQM